MKTMFCFAAFMAVIGGYLPSAGAEIKGDVVVKDWSKLKCMNFRSNNEIAEVERALNEAFLEKDFTEAQDLALGLMDNKLGCQQRYEIADIGYQSAVIQNDFTNAKLFMPVMRTYLKKKGRDVAFFDQLIRWVDANQAARDPNIVVEDRDAVALRDRTLHYVFRELRANKKQGGEIPGALCEVNFAISEYGRPKAVEAKCGRDDVAASLVKHIPKMLFAPKIVDGNPVAQERFSLNVRIE